MQGIRETTAFNLKLVFLVLFFFACFQSGAQQSFYDTDVLPPSFHQGRRDALRALLPPNSCAVIFANPIRNRSNDNDFQYSQDPDFYYLTGLNEPNAVIFIFSTPVKITGMETKELVLVQDRNIAGEKWSGKRLGIEGVVAKLGLKTVFLNTELKAVMPDLSGFDKVFAKIPTDIAPSDKNNGSLNSMVFIFKDKLLAAGKSYEAGPLIKSLASLREIKSKEEIVLMQKAVDITVAGHEGAIKATKPGMTEYQVQAIAEFYFKYNGSEYPGYGSISASGENSCMVHYETNRRTLTGSDMLLMDMGAEYHGYTADVSRTIPVDGTFSAEQKIIYELVLNAQIQAIELVRAGIGFQDPHRVATQVIAQGLIDLGIIKDKTEVGKYFMHHTSHYLGLAVHDAGNYGILRKGMVITVEPGIYIPEGSDCDKKWWNIGVRIEDDVLVTEDEPFVMSGKLAKTVADIEKLMKDPGFFDTFK